MKKVYWKSSESPLYVRLIWRKDMRHVVLFNEHPPLPKNSRRTLQNYSKIGDNGSKNTPKTPSENSTIFFTQASAEVYPLQTSCIVNSSNSSHQNQLDNSSNSSSISQRITATKSAPNPYRRNCNYPFVDEPTINLDEHGNLKSPTGEEQFKPITQNTFTDRVLQWLDSKNNFSFCQQTSRQAQRKSSAQKAPNTYLQQNKRPMTSVDYSGRNAGNIFKTDVPMNDKNDLDAYPNRAQLHVFVPT